MRTSYYGVMQKRVLNVKWWRGGFDLVNFYFFGLFQPVITIPA